MSAHLEKAFDFEESDVLLNRTGHLSENQCERLSQYRRIRRKGGKLAFGAMILTSVFWCVMWLYGIGFKFDPAKQLELTFALFAVLAVIWIIFLFFYGLGKRRSDLTTGKISAVEGFAELQQKKMPRSLGTAYFLTIGAEKFQLETQARYKALEKSAKYRVFFIKDPPVHIILSIAALKTPED
jgi:hypothetical protein